MDGQDNLTVRDDEFEKILRDGLNSSYKDDGLCVTEDLIARTLKAIADDADKDTATARRAKRSRFVKIASGIAAAAFIGVVGISLLRGRTMQKSMPTEDNAMMDSIKMSLMADVEAESDDIYDDACALEAWEEPRAIYNETAYDLAESVENGGADLFGAAYDFKTSSSSAFPEAAAENSTCAEESECDDEVVYEKESERENISDYLSSADMPLKDDDYILIGEESAELFDNIYTAALERCGAIVYDITGFMTDETAELIPEDIGECLVTVSHMGDGDTAGNLCTVRVYKGYCEIHSDNILSSYSWSYGAILYRLNDGMALEAEIREMLE